MKKHIVVVLTSLLLCMIIPAYALLTETWATTKNTTTQLSKKGRTTCGRIPAQTGNDTIDNIGSPLLGKIGSALATENISKESEDAVVIYSTETQQGESSLMPTDWETPHQNDPQGNSAEQLSKSKITHCQQNTGNYTAQGGGQPEISLQISEVLAVNTLYAVDGETPDFIELYNPSDVSLNLKGYGLSDNPNKPGKWIFPDTMIPPDGYVALFLSSEKTGFNLSGDGECALLSDLMGNPVSSVTFGPQQNDVALIYQDGKWYETWTPTPNQANILTDKAAYEQSIYTQNTAGLLISEVVSSNGTFDANGNAYDYVVLFNSKNKSISLSDFSLSDDVLNLDKWSFPKNSKLSPGGYAIVYMTGKDMLSRVPNTYYAPFKIGKTNSVIILSSTAGIVDKVSLGRQYGNIAYGRIPRSAEYVFFELQTPGKKNPESGFHTRTGEVTISPAGGLFEEAISIILDTEEGAVIHYTLDGMTPTEQSAIYSRPLEISANTVLRARAYSDGCLSSVVTSASYLFGVDVNVPVVSLMTDQKYLTDPGMGLFVKGFGSTPNYYQDWEYPMHVQYYDGGELLINQLASFRTSGALGLTRPQKTISLFARGALGEELFSFNPFPNRAYNSYNALTLRSGGTESRGTRFKDELLTSLAEGLNVLYQDAVPVVVYINGQYWGHYNLREKINQDSIAQWEGITDEKTIDGITILRSRGSVVHGRRDEMEALIQFCKSRDLNNPENLRYVQDRLDVMSYFDHAIIEIICGNSDMHNVRYYKVPGGKWKLALFDMDGCMDNLRRSPLNLYLTNVNEKMERFYHEPFAALMKVPEMRDLFLKRFGEILLKKFLAKDLEAKVDEWAGIIGPLMEDHVKRWPDTSIARWNKYVNLLRLNIRERPNRMVEQLSDAFSLTDEQVETYFGAFLNANQ